MTQITNSGRCRSTVSRRAFMRQSTVLAATALALPQSLAAADNGMTKVWALVTTGGVPYSPSFQTIFADPLFRDSEVWVHDHPAANFNQLFPSDGSPGARGAGAGADGGEAPARGRQQGAGAGAQRGGGPPVLQWLKDEPPDYPWDPVARRPNPGFDILVLYDQLDWPEPAQKNITRAIQEKAAGFVVIHHALGDNQAWPFWYQDVTGGLLVLGEKSGMKPSTIRRGVTLDVVPVGDHPILDGIGPMRLQNETAFKGMWQSPKVTPLLRTSNAASDATVAWVGVHDKSRVVCIQPGAARETHYNPMFRRLVHNAILWTAGRL